MLFQSLDWVERLSDTSFSRYVVVSYAFQSLDWVERLSDLVRPLVCRHPGTNGFQSLDWVERLSDAGAPVHVGQGAVFQSLDWVERLSDPINPTASITTNRFNPSTGLSVFQTTETVYIEAQTVVSIPRLG